ncbi:CRAL-TRIO domain-containing protein [Penicillium argentinense]|uniref:CRAL-TRIO domain-containing protein n=1 Tax=Penicillium argentinense TaxID=1131581 RepID=A0A9W9EJH0_9EURO|nr:CRAL-TRIO domain-containing protein [Penicillium argentinense]KAJ5082913.1 CRAL-TRIO domain-containing protein [Penicillium argentinense]
MRACSILRRHIHPSAKSLSQSSGGVSAQIARHYGQLPRAHRPPYSTQHDPRKASSSWIAFALLAVGGGACVFNYFTASERPFSAHSRPPPQQPFLGVIDTLKTMPVEPAPGTVGTLTPEQEAKLQEFWVLTLKVFGVDIEALEADASGKESADAAAASAAKKEKEKDKSSKRRWTLWGRSNDDDGDDAKSVSSASGITASLASINIAEGDDKYGQSKEFQQALVDLSAEEIRTAFWNMVKQDHPDALLLRFLRARKWDVKKALVMMISTMRWRLQDVHVDDDIMANGEALALKQSQSSDPAEKKKGEEFLHQMRMGKSFLHGVDRFGRPICVVRVRLHRASEQEVDTLERFTVYTIETARLLLAPPVETATIIFDMTDFTLANMDYTPVKFMIKCFEANYPESLGSVLIHKAPWIFSSIWSIIKGWLDPVVAAKIHFTKNRQDLEEFIPPSQIMKELEGDENWEYAYSEVQPGENSKMEDTETRDKLISERQELAKDIQATTIEWIRASLKNEIATASSIKEKRNGQIQQLRDQYWVIDPYIRTRSLYDRLNIVQGAGKIEFYPGTKKKAEETS